MGQSKDDGFIRRRKTDSNPIKSTSSVYRVFHGSYKNSILVYFILVGQPILTAPNRAATWLVYERENKLRKLVLREIDNTGIRKPSKCISLNKLQTTAVQAKLFPLVCQNPTKDNDHEIWNLI